MDHFRLARIDVSSSPGFAELTPATAIASGLKHVATAPRLKRVADTLTQLIGRPMRVELEAGGASGPVVHPDNRTQEDADQRDSKVAGGAGIDRRDALSLPLVRDVFEVFPDAMLVDARRVDPSESDQSGNSSKPAS